MTAPYLFRTLSLSVGTATLTVTHGLSVASPSLQVIVTDRADANNVRQVGLDANTVLLRANANFSLVDLAVMQIHSIQGGPA